MKESVRKNIDIRQINLVEIWEECAYEEKEELCNRFIEAVNKGELTLEDYKLILNIEGQIKEVQKSDIVSDIKNVFDLGNLDIDQQLEQILSMPLNKWKLCRDLYIIGDSENKCRWIEEARRLRDEHEIPDFEDSMESVEDRLNRTTDFTENGTNKRSDNVYDAIRFEHWDAAIGMFMNLSDEEINNIQLGEKTDEDVKRIIKFKEKLSSGEEIKKEDILGIENFVIDKSNLQPEIYKLLDSECLRVLCSDEHIEDIINALKYGNIKSISTPEFIDYVSFKFGDWIYEEFFNQGFHECFDHSEEFDDFDEFENTTEQNTWLSQKGVEIVANKIADIVNQSITEEPEQLISAILNIWKNFVSVGFDSKINILQDNINQKVLKKYSKEDFADINVRFGQIEDVMAETTIGNEMKDKQQEGQTQGD